jgi:hypothetical protein
MRLTRKTHPPLLALLVGAPMAANCGGSAAPTTHNDASVPTGGAGATGGTPNTAGKTGAQTNTLRGRALVAPSVKMEIQRCPTTIIDATFARGVLR